mgnify:CR=1 FL=1
MSFEIPITIELAASNSALSSENAAASFAQPELSALGKKNAIYSPIILASTYLWFNFAHLATQDMIFAFLVNLGIYALVKVNFNQNNNSLNNLYFYQKLAQ